MFSMIFSSLIDSYTLLPTCFILIKSHCPTDNPNSVMRGILSNRGLNKTIVVIEWTE